MILSFRCAETQALFEIGHARRWSAVAMRKLGTLNAAVTLEFFALAAG